MNKKTYIIIVAILIIAAGTVWYFSIYNKSFEPQNNSLDGFAKCLASKNITMYGAEWCPHCQNQKALFGDSFKYASYVECPQDIQKCLSLGIEGYPTWILPDGRKLLGEQSLENLSKESGCPLPSAGK